MKQSSSCIVDSIKRKLTKNSGMQLSGEAETQYPYFFIFLDEKTQDCKLKRFGKDFSEDIVESLDVNIPLSTLKSIEKDINSQINFKNDDCTRTSLRNR